MLSYIIIFGLFALINGATFLLDNEGWTIVGNKRTTEAKHQSYIMGPKMSNYILGTDDLVNVDFRNRDDKNLWYFRSPPITLVKRPVLMVFTITSFSGDFTKLNAGLPLVKVNGADNLSVVFDKLVFNNAQVIDDANTHLFDGAHLFNGKMTTVNVPLAHLNAKIFQKPFTIEILGDWTRGIETVAIDNVEFYY
jgi:hypothetical protein